MNQNYYSELTRLLKSSVALAVFSLAMPMLAVTNAQDATDEDEALLQDTIIVTATKRDQSIQDIAASISQFSGDDLVERGMDDLEKITTQVPNLSWGRYLNSTFVTIRGVGTTVDSGVAEPSVALYVDGVFLPRATMANMRQVDLQRAEVLRGPQGTLYGRNATGGAVNFISKKPTTNLERGMSVTVEDRNGYGIDGYVSGPLSDTIAIRLSGGIVKQDGWVDVINTGDKLAGTDMFHARLAGRFELTASSTLDLTLQYEKNEDNFIWASIGTPPNVLIGFFDTFAPDSAPDPKFTTEPNKIYANDANEGLLETTILSATYNSNLSDTLSLRSVTGYVDHTSGTTSDGDASDAFLVNLVNTQVTSKSFSQELNLIGESGTVSWLVGAYYFSEEHKLYGELDGDMLFFTLPTLPAGITPPAPVLALFGRKLNFPFVDLMEDTTSFALFADATFEVNEDFRIIAGARFNSEKKDFVYTAHTPGSDPVKTPNDTESDDFLPKIGFQYDVNDDMNIYGNWQKGVKSGGHQLTETKLFEPEEVSAFEFGVKSQSKDGRITFNGSAFSYDYSNLQASVTIPPNTTRIESGDAEILGLEAELFMRPENNINLNFGASFLSSEYTDLKALDQTRTPAPTTSTDLSGEEVIRAPKITLNAGASWEVPYNTGVLSQISYRADVFYTDKFKLSFFPYQATLQDSYIAANLSATLTDASGRWQVRVFIDNATDELYLNNATYLATTGAFLHIHSAPRTAGISLRGTF